MTKAIGALLCLLPFAALVGAMIRIDGWRATLAIWGMALAFTGLVYVGVHLLFGEPL